MSSQEPPTSPEQPAAQYTPSQSAAAQTQQTAAYGSIEEGDQWTGEPDELPRRPRRRPLGAVGQPIPLALLGVLLIAGGFLGGVLVEKAQSSSTSSPGGAEGFVSRLRAPRGGRSGAGSSSTSAGGVLGALAGSSSGAGRPVAGQVAYIAGNTLYVTNAEGNTVKVTTSAGTSVTRTVKGSVKGIHPGETVIVTGEAGSGGTISAESIRIGSGGGGLAALLGGSGALGSGRSASSARSNEQPLFGNGG